MNARLIALFVVASCLFCLNGAAHAKEGKIDFATQVRPILSSRCVNCHKSEAIFGDLNLENRALAFKKRKEGPVIIPGKPDSSRLFGVLYLSQKDPKAMPPNGHRVSEHEMQIIYDWIRQGANWPEGPEGVVHPLKIEKTRQ